MVVDCQNIYELVFVTLIYSIYSQLYYDKPNTTHYGSCKYYVMYIRNNYIHI